VLVIGRSDGVLDVWDLLDTTTKPSLSTQLFSTAVSSLEFRSGAGKQLLAVGDDKGAVHLLDFPLSLRRGVPNEEALVSAYLGRESARASYVQVRLEITHILRDECTGTNPAFLAAPRCFP
jgi:dynein intermediate chain 3, axonemal